MGIPSGFTLLEDERPVWRSRMSFKANWGLILLGILFLLFSAALPPLIIFAIIIFLIVALRVIATEYFITNKRIYVKYGIISRKVFEIKNEWITGVMVRQGIIGRILNYGDIIYSTPGQYAGSVIMIGVSDPMHIRTIIEDVLRKNKEAERIREKIRELEKEYEFGRISPEKYEELRKKYDEELKKYL
jgi:uncharacterized membrane protein YdbT with pleckstrin-like domain